MWYWVLHIKNDKIAHLVRVYSLSPECRVMAENVPIQPLNRLSLPIFHVTNSGLKDRKEQRFKRNTHKHSHLMDNPVEWLGCFSTCYIVISANIYIQDFYWISLSDLSFFFPTLFCSFSFVGDVSVRRKMAWGIGKSNHKEAHLELITGNHNLISTEGCEHQLR